MGIMNEINEMMINEVVTGLLSHIEDKEMIKEKANELLSGLGKIDNDMVVMIVKINGEANLCITKKSNVGDFEKMPEFINIENLIKSVIQDI